MRQKNPFFAQKKKFKTFFKICIFWTGFLNQKSYFFSLFRSLCHMGMNTGEISQLSYSYEDQISPLNPNALPYDPSMILTSSEQQPKRPNLCPLMRSNAAVAAPAACAVPNCQTLNVGSYYNCYNITIYKYMKTGPSV